MAEIWNTDEEAAKLRERFDALKAKGVKQAAFAREHKLKGGASMLNQHLKGHRPISQEAAIAYATAFNCPIAEISPRIAEDLRKAVARTPLSSDASPAPQAASLAELIKRFAYELQKVSAANRPLVAHAFKTWIDRPDQWELLAQQLRNLGLEAGFAKPDPRKIVRLLDSDGEEEALLVTPEAMALAQGMAQLGESEVASIIYDEMEQHLDALLNKYAVLVLPYPPPPPAPISKPPTDLLEPMLRS